MSNGPDIPPSISLGDQELTIVPANCSVCGSPFQSISVMNYPAGSAQCPNGHKWSIAATVVPEGKESES